MKFFKYIQQNKYADMLIIGLGIFLGYAILIPFLHYYIDDWYWVWTWNTFGHAGITHYFATNRPIWGLFYHLTLPVLSIHPILAHIFALVIRLLSTLLFFHLIKLLWPDNRKANLFASFIFAFYPGFCLQSIAITYSHIFVILSIFILSLIFTIQWINTNGKLFLILSLLLSFINLISMEYFFSLELIRFVIILVLYARQGNHFLLFIKHSIAKYLPYLTILIISVVIRLMLLTQIQTNRYGISLFSDFRKDPIGTTFQLIARIVNDIYVTTIVSWKPAIEKLLELQTLNRTTILIIAICLFFVILSVSYFLFVNSSEKKNDTTQIYETAVLGLFGILFAGWPFWLTYMEVTPYHLLSRYTLPFLLGVSILFGFLYTILSRYKVISSIFMIITIFTAMYYQMKIMNDFRIETQQNREMMWQMKWRMPDLEVNTLVVTTDYPNEYYDIATLATELAVIYPKQPVKYELPYFMLYSRNLNENNNDDGLQKNIPIEMNNVTAVFSGNTSQMIGIDYDPAKCVRLLDPELDGVDTNLHEHVQKAAQISDLSLINLEYQSDGSEMVHFSKENTNSWCYYFEKADLAKQKKDWTEVINLYDKAIAQGFTFKSERERYPFIEAYAQLGQWDKAYSIIENADQKELAPGICSLTERINNTIPNSKAKTQFLKDISHLFTCQ
jgi:hypothetical protein